MADLIAYGRVIRGWIGIVPVDVSENLREQFGLPAAGVLIANLYPGSPAQKAGLQPGDVLTAIEGVPVRTAQEAVARVATHRKVGETIKLRVLRNGRTMDLQTQVMEQPRGRQ
jgi:S1-C subfamily serine protease